MTWQHSQHSVLSETTTTGALRPGWAASDPHGRLLGLHTAVGHLWLKRTVIAYMTAMLVLHQACLGFVCSVLELRGCNRDSCPTLLQAYMAPTITMSAAVPLQGPR